LDGNLKSLTSEASQPLLTQDICWQSGLAVEYRGQPYLAKLTKPSIMAMLDVKSSKLVNIEQAISDKYIYS
jgi:hypothetical protein